MPLAGNRSPSPFAVFEDQLGNQQKANLNLICGTEAFSSVRPSLAKRFLKPFPEWCFSIGDGEEKAFEFFTVKSRPLEKSTLD
ncbi:MAG TPA: hypothetical protein VGF96_00045 [Terracidiphilus sp.]